MWNGHENLSLNVWLNAQEQKENQFYFIYA